MSVTLLHGIRWCLTRGKSELRACGPQEWVLQAMLQGILQGVGPISWYCKVLTGCFDTRALVKSSGRVLIVLVGVLSWALCLLGELGGYC